MRRDGIQRSILKRLGGRQTAVPRRTRWQHKGWPARAIDRFVVSFPKSGRTWLRVLMAAAQAYRSGARVDAEIAESLAQQVASLDGHPLLFTHALAEDETEPVSLRAGFPPEQLSAVRSWGFEVKPPHPRRAWPLRIRSWWGTRAHGGKVQGPRR